MFAGFGTDLTEEQHKKSCHSLRNESDVDDNDDGNDGDNNDDDDDASNINNANNKRDADMNMNRIFEQIDLVYSCKIRWPMLMRMWLLIDIDSYSAVYLSLSRSPFLSVSFYFSLFHSAPPLTPSRRCQYQMHSIVVGFGPWFHFTRIYLFFILCLSYWLRMSLLNLIYDWSQFKYMWMVLNEGEYCHFHLKSTYQHVDLVFCKYTHTQTHSTPIALTP